MYIVKKVTFLTVEWIMKDLEMPHDIAVAFLSLANQLQLLDLNPHEALGIIIIKMHKLDKYLVDALTDMVTDRIVKVDYDPSVPLSQMN